MGSSEARIRARASYLKRKKEAGDCRQCDQPHLQNSKLCSGCRDKARAYSRKRYYANLQSSRETARNAARERFKRDPEKARAYARERYRLNPQLFRGYELKQHYGISLAEFDALNARQGGCCAICRKPPAIGKRGQGHSPKRPPRLYVDHDHATGKVRGLLCHWCNSHIVAGIEKSGATLAQIAAYMGGGKSLT